MRTTFHRLPGPLFQALGAGAGGPEAITRLHEAQVSKHILLIHHLLNTWPMPDPERDRVAAALELVRRRAPGAFREVIGAPLVGGWAAITARAESRGSATRAEFQHLGALAVVAGAAGGLDVAAEVPVHGGVVVLPGVAAVQVGEARTARAEARNGGLQVSPGGRWLPVRRLTAESAGRRLSVTLDDVHPYRHGHHVPPATRLAGDEVRRWQQLFAGAWALLADRLPGRADELSAGLRTLVPLRTEERTARSATIRHAFGVFGLSRPPTAAEFAVTLIHEFQHSKLSALLDLVPLTDPADQRRYFAPWRKDPRPLAGLLQGVYAFTAVADTWRALRGAAIEEDAEARFAATRLQVDRGLTAIEESGALTPAGRELAGHLRRTADGMLAETVPPGIATAAEAALDRTHRTWLGRHGRAA